MGFHFRGRGVFYLVLCFLFAGFSASAQIAGIKVNGVFIPADDTVKVCKGNSLSYSYAYAGSPSFTWNFSTGGNPQSSNNSSVSVQYNSNGVFRTTQTVTSGNFSDSTFLYVHVSDVVPVSTFTSSANDVCGDSVIRFFPTLPMPAFTYLWNFQDGTTSNLDTATHQFLSAIGASGTTQIYNVILTVTNEFGCRGSSTNQIRVKRVPDASIMRGNPTEIDSNFYNGLPTFRRCNQTGSSFKFKFLNASTTPTTIIRYEIDWGDGTQLPPLTTWPAGTLIDHDYVRGAYVLTVRATDVSGCVGIKKYNVFFGLAPGGGLTGVEKNEVCVGEYLRFPVFGYGNNTPGTTYLFSVNDGSPPIFFNPSFPPPDTINHPTRISSCGFSSSGVPNSFEGLLLISNACSNSPTPSRVGNLLVSGRPAANLRVSPSAIACTGTAIRLENTSTFGQIVNAQTNTCSSSGKQVWSISPSTYTLSAGSDIGDMGSTPGICSSWRSGSPVLNVTFNAVGIYTIKLYICNERCGMDSVVRTICVRNPPQALFTMSKDSSCGPSEVDFSNLSPVGVCQSDSYQWTISYSDNAGCGNNQNPKFTFINSTPSSFSPKIRFDVPGRYIIELQVLARGAGLACPTAVIRDTFFVKDKPKPALAPILPTCLGSCVLPKATVSNCYGASGPDYLWTFTNASIDTSTAITPGPVCYQSLGKHLFTLKVSNECGFTIISDSVSIVPRPAADAGVDKSFCSGLCDTLGTPAVSGLRYQWTPATGLSNATVARPRICLTYAGPADSITYQYVLKVSTADTTCFGIDTVSVTVKRSPQVKIVPDSASICLGDSVLLYATTTDTTALSYVWSPATGLNTTTGDTVKASPAVLTSYIVTGSAANGCAARDTARVRIKPETKADFRWKKSVLCTPVNIDTVITNMPSAGNGTYLWYHNGLLIGTNTTGAVPSHLLTTPGASDTIKLVVLSSGGCKPDSMQHVFTTVPGVVPSFIKSSGSGCAPLVDTFTNTSTSLSSSIQFFWNFGNGTTSTLIQPGAVTYAGSPNFRDTVYYISLRADNGCNASFFRDSVKVLPPPRARFIVDTTRGCSPFTASIINTSQGNNFVYYWDFGDGSRDTTATLGTLTHTYTTGSVVTYTIRLISQNSCGRDTFSISLVVSPTTIRPGISVNGNQVAGCAPHLVTFNNGSVGAAQLTWNFGDGSPLVITPNSQGSISHLYNAAGNYVVNVRLKNDCSDTTVQLRVTVYPSPVANFSVASATACTNQPVTVTNASANANAYEWFWGDGSSPSSFASGSHAYAAPGNYTITLVAKRADVSGFVCTDTLRKSVTVIDKITARIVAAPGRACVPYNLQLSAGNATNASLVEWFIYDNSATPIVIHSFGSTAAHQFSAAGTDSVKLVVHTTTGCTDTVIYRFQVSGSPKALLTPDVISTCNHDTLIRFSAQTVYSGTGNVSLSWFVNGQPAGTGNPFSYRFSVPSTAVADSVFTIRVLPQNAAGCGDSSNAGRVTIYAVPLTQIDVSPSRIQFQPNYTFTFKDLAPGVHPKSYLWRLGDRSGQTRTGKEITYTYSDSGSFNVRMSVLDLSNGCTASDSVAVKVLHVPGYLYIPNAMCIGCSNNSLRQFLPLGKGLKDYRLRIYSNWGQLIFETTKLNADGSPAEAWDGNYQGRPVNIAEQNAFRWIAEARFVNGTEWNGMIYPPNANYVKSAFITFVK